MATKGLKSIAPVPTASDFLDIVLSKTQRKTPTVIHKGFKISRIRSFYMRKVKFTQDAFDEKLEAILSDFPILDNLHPFLASLLNVLYDKNHYKLALGQLNTAKHLIDQVGKDYCRLLKFGDSLYRCKQLKKAGLGRMATIMRRQKEPLAYLEQVRQHMSRLPTIDPTTRTLLICGYPNVGKSSFMNKITRADVDVQPYAFTTKSLFVGHMDYKYLRWQVIDTPGILDHPLDEMNTIEMQSITAMAHLRSCILYFMDLSEQCGYTVEAQCQLFHSIKPLFTNKPKFLVINKIDVCKLESLDPERKQLIDEIVSQHDIYLLQVSCFSEEGVMEVRNKACDALLSHRVEAKEKTKRVENVANRVRVALPVKRDSVVRQPFIPDAVLQRKKYNPTDADRPVLERDLEAEGGGPGVYSVDLKKSYLLSNDEWKNDTIPEIINGKNIADFVDPDIFTKLEELEAEEERLEAEGFYESDHEAYDDLDSEQEEAIQVTAKSIQTQKKIIRADHSRRSHQNLNRAVIARPDRPAMKLSEMTNRMKKDGIDTEKLEKRAELIAKAKRLAYEAGNQARKKRKAEDAMEVDSDWSDEDDEANDTMEIDGDQSKVNKKARRERGGDVIKGAIDVKRAPRKDRRLAGIGKPSEETRAKRLQMFQRREPNRLAKAGEADRYIPTKMPKHLFSGKRKAGKTNRR
ncbi:nucleolar GTP-binding protein 1 [Phakopsora pachyrhizi]|uniref:Nucleolar GTP-binding protein 1 n=1 Tax=Phakopsora pachyrhizi TaxID=170000 RepID=A0AAV0B124_PHAPC|nr:nucleolar GTP-binding protein 1 [Phakopsora pachyrhizi]